VSKNNSQKEINLRDFIWEEEEFQFNPKVNRHKKFLHSKKRQLEKEVYANNKKTIDPVILDGRKKYISKIEESLLQDYYDRDDEEDYKGYRIK
jgi:hypothetical protein